MAGRSHPRRRGALEREVVAALAATPAPMTPSQVQARLGDGLAYTTVMTTLSRLHAKGAVVRSAQGRGYAYALEGTRIEAEAGLTAREMSKLLATGDRATVLSRFVQDLDADSAAMLRELLESDRSAADGADPRGDGAGA